MQRSNSASQSIHRDKDSYKLSLNLTSSPAHDVTFRSSTSHPDSSKTSHDPDTTTSETTSWSITNFVAESQHAKNFQRKATIMMSMRSNAKGVKELVVILNEKCDTAYRTSTISEVDIPYYECAMLSEIANDDFYRVVIRSANGIATIVKAMKVFPEYASLQEVCCNALGHLYVRNGSDLKGEANVESMHQIVAAMRMHTSSAAVQSAAGDTLRVISAIVLSH
jgi:predicted protein tyrosine phosphatase